MASEGAIPDHLPGSIARARDLTGEEALRHSLRWTVVKELPGVALFLRSHPNIFFFRDGFFPANVK